VTARRGRLAQIVRRGADQMFGREQLRRRHQLVVARSQEIKRRTAARTFPCGKISLPMFKGVSITTGDSDVISNPLVRF